MFYPGIFSNKKKSFKFILSLLLFILDLKFSYAKALRNVEVPQVNEV